MSNGTVSDLAHRYTPVASPPLSSPIREREQQFFIWRQPANLEEQGQMAPSRDQSSETHDRKPMYSPIRASPQRQETSPAVMSDHHSLRRTSYQALPKPDHAASCGCATCSVSHYSRPPSALHLAQTQALKDKEKKPGWIRRLSMPVGNAFSSASSTTTAPGFDNGLKGDYKKHNTRNSIYGHSRMGSRSVTDLALGRK